MATAAKESVVDSYLKQYLKACEDQGRPVLQPLQKTLFSLRENNNLKDAAFILDGTLPEIRDIRIDNECLAILLQSFSRNFVRDLSLSYNKITNEGATLLAGFLRDDRVLRKLNLKCNDIEPEGVEAIARALNVNEKLASLDLSYNEAGEIGGLALAAMLQVNTSIQELRIAGTKLSTNALIAFATVLQANDTLELLDISDNMGNGASLSQTLQNDIMQHLSKMITYNESIKILGMQKLSVTDWVMCDYLARSVGQNKALRELDLSCNKISRDGCVALCRALHGHSNLRVLSLSCNAVQDEGAVALAEMLKKNDVIEILHVDHNKISGKGLVALAGALRENTSLKKISVWGNEWDTPACEAFFPLIGSAVRTISFAKTSSALGASRAASSLGTTSSLRPVEAPRFDAESIDVCFYSVENGLQVARRQDATPKNVYVQYEEEQKREREFEQRALGETVRI